MDNVDNVPPQQQQQQVANNQGGAPHQEQRSVVEILAALDMVLPNGNDLAQTVKIFQDALLRTKDVNDVRKIEAALAAAQQQQQVEIQQLNFEQMKLQNQQLAAQLDLQKKAVDAAQANADKESAVEVLAKQIEKEAAEKHEPWRPEIERLSRLRDHICAQNKEAQKEQFLAHCKRKRLTPTEVLVHSYLLYGQAYDLAYLQGLMLVHPVADRIKLHNLHVAKLRGDDFIERHGRVIAKLEFPLYPAEAEFNELSQNLLDTAAEALHGVQGGAARDSDKSQGACAKLFKEPTGDVLGGAYIAPVQKFGDAWGVDLVDVEAFCGELRTNIEANRARAEQADAAQEEKLQWLYERVTDFAKFSRKNQAALRHGPDGRTEYRPRSSSAPSGNRNNFGSGNRGFGGGRGGRGGTRGSF